MSGKKNTGVVDKDRSRQWVGEGSKVAAIHILRYEFAAQRSEGRVLDAACGCGYGSLMMYLKTGNVIGIDSDQEAIDWAKWNFKGPLFLKARIEDAPWDGGFDTVVSLETIEHIQDPSPVLKTLRKSCRGMFIASVPNEDYYPFDPEVFKGDNSPHYRHYRPDEFDKLLKDHGFKVKERFYQKDKVDAEIREGTEGKFIIYACE